jgi:hypothetical protein
MLDRNGGLKTKEGPSREFGLRSQHCGHHAIAWLAPCGDFRHKKAGGAWQAASRVTRESDEAQAIVGQLFSRSLRPASAVTEMVAMLAELADQSEIDRALSKRSEPWRRRLRWCVAVPGPVSGLLPLTEKPVSDAGYAVPTEPSTHSF